MMKFKQFYEMSTNQNNLKKQLQNSVDVLRSIVDPFGIKMMEDVPKAHDNTTKIWSDPKFQNWLNQHGIKFNGIPNFKDGAAGRAYFVSPFVVKFTGNRVEANVAKMVAGREDLPSSIIDVLPIGNFFAILEHEVHMGDKISKNIRDAADWLTVLVDKNPNMNGFPSNENEQSKLIQTMGAPHNLFPYMKMVIKALSALYQATGFKHDDAGPSNIGVHNNKIVFPDLGPNKTKDFSTQNAMSQIANNRKSLGLGTHAAI